MTYLAMSLLQALRPIESLLKEIICRKTPGDLEVASAHLHEALETLPELLLRYGPACMWMSSTHSILCINIANSSPKGTDAMSNLVQAVNNLKVAASLEQTSSSLFDSHLSLRRVHAGSGQEYPSSLAVGVAACAAATFIRP